jgi:predicted nucleotidyltransferase
MGAMVTRARESVIAPALLADLPANVGVILEEFVQVLLQSAAGQVEAVILFGSAAEGRLRSTSDVNLLVIARDLTLAQLDEIRTPLRAGAAAVGLAVMFLDCGEVSHAFEAFAVKFTDIKERHRVLFGRSPLESIQISREAAVRRLRQVLLNLTLRLRERYAMDGDREESLARALAESTGPLRASAAVLLSLRDGRSRTPKVALEEYCAGEEWRECLTGMSAVRQGELLPPGAIRPLFRDVIRLLVSLDAAAHRLS